ncbi:MAG: Glucosamine-phosphate N-acetyltransferase-like protein [Piccolia ochrophora]|nr:MAG: Glucosamine-phosphate N-acetyltransferase-like protein [Piccolia ochrophora]
MAANPLFADSLISPTVSSSLPDSYTIRPLWRSDFRAGFLDVLRILTTVGDINEERWNAQFEWMAKRNQEGDGPGEYFILVVLDPERVVGAGTLVVERKLLPGRGHHCQDSMLIGSRGGSIHNLGLVGHIEDIAVAKDQQGKKLGLKIIQALDYVAEQVGCYKSILDCSEANEGFYVKCGFKRSGLEMAHYY